MLDVGAGTGLWRTWFRRHRPDVRYRSIDVSPFACERYGHELRDIGRWPPASASILVVCHSVLQYLDDAAAERAIDNIGHMCRGLLYLEVVTKGVPHPRPREVRHAHGSADRAWYRTRLAGTSSRSVPACGRRDGARCSCSSWRRRPPTPAAAPASTRRGVAACGEPPAVARTRLEGRGAKGRASWRAQPPIQPPRAHSSSSSSPRKCPTSWTSVTPICSMSSARLRAKRSRFFWKRTIADGRWLHGSMETFWP